MRSVCFKASESKKLDPRAVEGVLIQVMDGRVYKIPIIDEHSTPRIVDSRHVAFDESTFPGANYLSGAMADENAAARYSSDTDDPGESERLKEVDVDCTDISDEESTPQKTQESSNHEVVLENPPDIPDEQESHERRYPP